MTAALPPNRSTSKHTTVADRGKQPARVPLTQAEILAGQRRYLTGLHFRGVLPTDTGEGDWLLEQLNGEGD